VVFESDIEKWPSFHKRRLTNARGSEKFAVSVADQAAVRAGTGLTALRG